jgi:hypothetical protein
MRLVATATAVLLVAVVAVLAAVNAQDPSPGVLAERCRACQPAWNGYQEDIKEIGARPVARWHGQPVSLSYLPGEVRLTMALQPPWDTAEAALPVLLKDPEGRVMRDDVNEISGSYRVYRFLRPASEKEPVPPWLEIQYPHTKQRLFLDVQGDWHAPANGQP